MRFGTVYESGEVVLACVQFTDSLEIKQRPAVVLFEEWGNIIIAGITSNVEMKGIPLTIKEGAAKESVIKLNYIYTVSEKLIMKRLFSLSKEKKRIVHDELLKRFDSLKSD